MPRRSVGAGSDPGPREEPKAAKPLSELLAALEDGERQTDRDRRGKRAVFYRLLCPLGEGEGVW